MRLFLLLSLAFAPLLHAQGVPDTTALFPAPLDGDQWGYIDRTGTTVLPAEYDAAYPFADSLARVLRRGRTYYIDREGTRIETPRLESGQDFAQGVAVVVTDHYGKNVRRFLDAAGAFVHGETRYSQALEYRESLAPVRRLEDTIVPVLGPLCEIPFIRRNVCTKTIERPWIYVDQTGEPVIEHPMADSLSLDDLVFEHATVFAEGRAAVAVREAFFRQVRWGFIDTAGTFVIEPQYQAAFPFAEGRARVVRSGLFGYVGAGGNVVVAPRYPDAGNFAGGRARVRTEEGWGYIDREGGEAIPVAFEAAFDFSEGVAAVREQGRWRFIDAEGAQAFAGQFDFARSFRNGLAYVRDGDREGYVDRTGTFIWER
ncbi:MAG: WG repeat-containing protein [Bacteroidota bacterium]